MSIQLRVPPEPKLKMNQNEPKISLGMGTGVDFIVVGGTFDYNELENKPKIEGTELEGDLELQDIGVGDITKDDIDDIFEKITKERR